MSEVTHPPYLNIPATKINKFAKIISDVLNPVFGGIFVVGLLMLRIIPNPVDAMKWLGITVIITSAPTLLYVLYLVHTGYLVDIYMPEQDKRLKPILAILGWLVVSMGILRWLGAPQAMLLMLIAVIAQIALLGIITPIWKISFHSAAIMAVAIIIALLPNKLAWVLLLLVPVVGWARVRLRRHTVMQVLAGYLAGIVVAVPAFYVIKLTVL